MPKTKTILGIKKVTMEHVVPGSMFFIYNQYNREVEKIKIYGPVVDRAIAYQVISHGQRHFKLDLLFPGDCGIRPLNYDERFTQIFFTEADTLRAVMLWDGQYPNFLNELVRKLSNLD